MHIPDGIISVTPLIIFTIITICLLIVIFYKSKDILSNEKNIPLIALFIVATVIVQYIELPLPVTACVHISLITIIALYDLRTSMIVYMFVTIIQAFLGEGGISTLGVNLLNLAILAPLIAYGLYTLLSRFNKDVALFISGFGTITILGLIVSMELAICNVYPIQYGLFTIVPVEAIVGVLEGVVTVIVMKALYKAKPELVPVLSN